MTELNKISVSFEKWEWFDILDALEYYKPSQKLQVQNLITNIQQTIQRSLRESAKSSQEER